MALQSMRDIQDHADSIEDLAALHRHFSKYTPSELYNLRILAVMCGYPNERVEYINPADLKALLTTTLRGGPQAGIMLASRIARANGCEIDQAALARLPGPLDDVTPPQHGLPASPMASPPDGDTYVTTQRFAREIKGLSDTLKAYADGKDVDLATALQGSLDEMGASLPGLVQAALDARTATHLVVQTPSTPLPTALGLVHRATPRIIRALNAGLNVYLHGPAGSGKTTVGRKCAEAFGLHFYTAAKVESEYLLLGFRDAKGEVVRTPFREAYEHGGVFLFDELDGSSPGAIVALNMALANGECPFPDGLIPRHKDFKCIAAGNTTLSGGNRQYSGRMQMDGASVDRFYFIAFDYDEALETELAPNKDWCAHVQAVRKVVKERGLTHLVTPRATLDGCKALAAGDTWEEAEISCIFKGLDADTVASIRKALPATKPNGNETGKVWEVTDADDNPFDQAAMYAKLSLRDELLRTVAKQTRSTPKPYKNKFRGD